MERVGTSQNYVCPFRGSQLWSIVGSRIETAQERTCQLRTVWLGQGKRELFDL